MFVAILTLLFMALFSAIGAWAGSRVFAWKNRQPTSGAILGSVTGIFPLLLLIFLLVTLITPRLKPGARGYQPRRGQQPPSDETDADMADRLIQLRKLHETGLITDTEYNETKTQLMSSFVHS